MLDGATYEEVVEWCVIGDSEFLLASDVDLALQEAAVEDTRDALEKMRSPEQAPPDVAQAQALTEAAALSPDEVSPEQLTEAKEVLSQWRQRRWSSWEFLQEKLRLQERALEDMVRNAPEGAVVRARIFGFRKIRHGEHKEIEGRYTRVDQTQGTREVDRESVNDEILSRVLCWERIGGAETPPLEGFITEEDHQLVFVLTRRMWFRNGLTPGMARFFRGGGAGPRVGKG